MIITVMVLELSCGISVVVSSSWSKRPHVSLDHSRSMPVDQPQASTFRVLRGTVLEPASISPDLGFRSPLFSRRGLGGVAPKPGRLASHSLCARGSSDSHFIIGRQTTRV